MDTTRTTGKQSMAFVLALLFSATAGCSLTEDNASSVGSPTALSARAERASTAPVTNQSMTAPPSGGAPGEVADLTPGLATAAGPRATLVATSQPGAVMETRLASAVEEVTERVRPAVVFLAVTTQSPKGFPQQVPQRGVGSGVIYDPRGYILTNNHVVECAAQVEVILTDGRRFEGRVVGRDPRTDLAVVKISGSDLPTASLGDSDQLDIGEWVVAIGNALGLPGGPTVTAGVVGALDRVVQEPNGVSLTDLIQTDAAINPGNSGGPLLNLRGEVIGINTAGAVSPQGGQAAGIGFAININRAKTISRQLVAEGRIVRPYLGMVPITITPALAARFGLPVESGVGVASVDPGSPAAGAGLTERDIIIAIDGRRTGTEIELRQALERREPGERVSLTVVHPDGARERVTVQLAEDPPPTC